MKGLGWAWPGSGWGLALEKVSGVLFVFVEA